MISMMTNSQLAFSFVLGLSVSTDLATLSPTAQFEIKLSECIPLENSASLPLSVSNERFPHGATNAEGGPLISTQCEGPTPNSQSTNAALHLSNATLRDDLSSISFEDSVLIEAPHDPRHNDPSWLRAPQVLREFANGSVLLGEEESSFRQTPLTDLLLHQENFEGVTSSKKRDSPELPRTSFLIENDEKHDRRAKKPLVVNSHGDERPSCLGTEASQVHLMPYMISHTESNYGMHFENHPEQVLDFIEDGTLKRHHWEDVNAYLPPNHCGEVALKDFPVTVTELVPPVHYERFYAEAGPETAFRDHSFQFPGLFEINTPKIPNWEDTHAYHPQNIHGNVKECNQQYWPYTETSLTMRPACAQPGLVSQELAGNLYQQEVPSFLHPENGAFQVIEDIPIEINQTQDLNQIFTPRSLERTSFGRSMGLSSQSTPSNQEGISKHISHPQLENFNEGESDATVYYKFLRSKPSHEVSLPISQIPSNQAYDSIHLSSGNLDPRVMAWISSMTENIIKDELYFLHQCKIKILEAFKQSQLSDIEPSLFGVSTFGREHENYLRKLRALDKFLKHLWFLNSILFKTFQKGDSFSNTYHEQKGMFKWLMEEIISHRSHSLKDSALESMIERPVDTPVSTVKDLISGFLDLKDDGSFWEIDSLDASTRYIKVKGTRVKMTEAAIWTQIAYFKSTNKVKFSHFFGTDRMYIMFLASTKNPKFTHPWRRHMVYHEHILGGLPFPWSSKCNPKQNIPKHSPLYFSLEDHENFHHVIDLNMRLIKMTPGSEEYFHPRENDPIIYVWISLISIKKQGSPLLDLQAHFRFNTEHLLGLGISPLEVEAKSTIQDIFREVSSINMILLEYLDPGTSSEKFEAEQKSMIEWLSHILGWSFSIQKTSSQKSEKFLSLLKRERADLENSEVWKFPTNSRQSIKGFQEIDGHGIMVTKLAVHAVGSYYKVKNADKWNEFFEYDDKFLAILVEISSRFYYNNYKHNVILRKERSRDMELLPWNNPLYLDINQIEYLKEQVLYSRYSNSVKDLFPKGALEKITAQNQQSPIKN